MMVMMMMVMMIVTMMTEHAVRKLPCLRASVGVEPACVWYSAQKASHAPCVRPRADLRHAGSSVGEREREGEREKER